MRDLFRQLGLVAAAVAVVFYCSCERHHPSELAHGEEHAKSGAAAHELSEGAKKQPSDEKARDTDQAIATTAMSVTPPPKESPTPANFFPTATPH
ncbi:MAG TPA: hypothetical protein VF511_10365 [Chthoniobacterales bacterium]|jgi:hypothetical protein